MGNIQPLIYEINSTLGAINGIANGFGNLTGNRGQTKALRAQQDLAMKSLQEQQALSTREAREKAERDRAKIALDAKAEEDRRRDALRRAIARQNVNRGAGGVSKSGSNEAILLGLYNESGEDRSYNKSLDQLRYNTIDSGLYDLNQRNVLERTQLAERQRLEREIGRY